MLLELPEVKLALFTKCLDVICDEGHTPHIVVNTKHEGYQGCPPNMDNGLVVLSISGNAARNFYMDEAGLSFSCSSGGLGIQVEVPMEAVAEIHAKEDPTLSQPFPIKVELPGVILKEVVKATVTDTAPRPIKRGFKPVVIKGGKA